MISTPLQILLVEDDDAYAALVTRMLRSSSVELVVVDHMKAAIEQLGSRSFDVVVTDLNLPDSRGFETFQRIIAAAPKLPVLVLTGQDDDTLGLRTVQTGAQDYLVKDQLTAPILMRVLTYAIERKRLQLETARIHEALKEQNEHMLADLRMAREVQAALMPSGAEKSNGVISFAHRLLPAQAVGGDFFAELCPARGLCGVVVCDVMGHGVRAALITGLLRALVDETSLLTLGPELFFEQLNRNLRTILRQADQQIFVTAVCCVVDPAERRVRFASAGHPNPLLLDPSTGRVSQLETQHGPPLGISDASTWTANSTPFTPGQRIMLLTDGLYEVEGSDGSQFGLDRLQDSVSRKLRLSSSQLLAELIEEAQEFSSTGDFNDDVCAVIFEYAKG